MSYCLYLRKSRADIDAESRGESETLARHEQHLLSIASKMRLNITAIYKEIVSGETIIARPVMQKLLSEVEQGLWEGVLVMEVERLARGNTLDQGLVSQAFQISSTKIVTPAKTYDPNNEFDEEYFEFGLFMSRREYKTINRRIQRGRIASVNEGKFISPSAPYGYDRVKITDGRGYTLAVNAEESKAVKIMYEMYATTQMGSRKIAIELNKLGFKPRKSDKWSAATIKGILGNPVYMGYIRWGDRIEVKTMKDGIVHKSSKYNPNKLLVKGLHEPIISADLYNKAQEVKNHNMIPSLNGRVDGLKNPLAGFMVCGKCHKAMSRQDETSKNRKTKSSRLVCPNLECNNISSRFDYVEEALLQSLKGLLQSYIVKLSEEEQIGIDTSNEQTIQRLSKEKEKVNKQLEKLHDLLEQGIYDSETFLQRSKILTDNLNVINESLEYYQKKILENNHTMNIKDFILKVENVLALYSNLVTPEDKNLLLKSVISKVLYLKTEKGKGKEKAFSLDISTILKV